MRPMAAGVAASAGPLKVSTATTLPLYPDTGSGPSTEKPANQLAETGRDLHLPFLAAALLVVLAGAAFVLFSPKLDRAEERSQ